MDARTKMGCREFIKGAWSMKGKRIYLEDDGRVPLLKPGEYLQLDNGTWIGCSPNGHGCNLASHKVVEHEDGSISVSPSIRIYDSTGDLWHGFLEKGNWRTA